jgi:transcription initiation factor TFIIA large subunit
LCLYEKVHRTKNKWRATMNHGIVCIDGREWVFEKGNGEYEW